MGERVTYYAGIYDVPESLIDRSIRRESGFNPTLRRGPYWGLMQLRLDTARSVGYRGPASGLLDEALLLLNAALREAGRGVASPVLDALRS